MKTTKIHPVPIFIGKDVGFKTCGERTCTERSHSSRTILNLALNPDRIGSKSLSLIFIFVCCFLPAVSFPQSAWTASPFDQKVFIENKGQFPIQRDNEKGGMADSAYSKSAILFGASSEGVELYFSANGLTYKHDEVTHPSIPEGEEFPAPAGEMEGAKIINTISHYLFMKWVGSNPATEIISEEPVSFYYTYSGAGKDADSAINPVEQMSNRIKANAYKKIIYKNLYPSIDLEYVFPSDSGGIKYSLIIHSGANTEVIKMKYENAESVSLDSDGNAVIKSSFGEFVDHAPKTFYEDGTNIESAFELKGNIVLFKLNEHETSNLKLETLIIDPWTTTPTFTGYNAAYDLEYDLKGNVYVYGGRYPYQEVKFNSSGVIQWVYTTNVFLSSPYPENYGDFAVDINSGSSYIVEGFNKGRVIKLNASGLQTGLFPGNPQMNEMWRVVYNNCTKKVIIAGGGNVQVSYKACILDTNVSGITPVDVLSTTDPLTDICLLALDNSNNCYMATAKGLSVNFDNMMLKCPGNTLLPVSYMVRNNHKFREVYSVKYVNNTLRLANGMNGMAVSNNYLYTYDGSLIQRWNKNTGTLINSATITPPVYTSMGSIKVSWGGIAVDNCDNIYVGKQSSVVRYDTNFTVVSTQVTANTVYDVRLAPGNLLYACGRSFVSSFQLNTIGCSSLTLNTSSACVAGSATVLPVGGSSPYTYLWNPSGQTTQTATGLPPGNYTVTVTDASCIPQPLTATVTVTAVGGPAVSLQTQTNVLCNGDSSGTVTVFASGGTGALTYNWLSLGGTSASATGLSAGTYTVTVIDSSGCSQTQTVTITEPGVLTATTVVTNALCNGVNNGTAAVTASGGTGSLAYSWSPSGETTSTATGLSTGTYTVTVTDANGCTQTATAVVTSTGGPAANASANVTITAGSLTTLTADGGDTYSWSNGANGSSIAVAPLVTTVYCVTVTDTNNCTDTACVTVTIEQIDCSLAGELYLPNAFSPNGDGENDKFQIYYGNPKCIKTFKLIIYNRWGEKVFETNDPSAGWDGSFRGKTEGAAVFVYYLEATLISGEEIMREGNISVIH